MLPGTTFLGASVPIGVVTVVGFVAARIAVAPPANAPAVPNPTGNLQLITQAYLPSFPIVPFRTPNPRTPRSL